jgi:K(+)-stimulated pyrophosphate-energized sodium pump
MPPTMIVVAAVGGVLALIYAVAKSQWIYRQNVDNPTLVRISGYIAEGAQAFLIREYKVLVPFIIIVAAFLALANQGAVRLEAVAFALGAVCSASSGWFGMKVATAANARTANAAEKGIGPALGVAFAGGSVMGMTVVGLAMIGISIVLTLGIALFGSEMATLRDVVFPILYGFSLGASSIALFARVGGGIFTKAADVGADLVGKVEAGIPEDDPRNPAVIADNVGDNVGDVAGMGADLFESYVGSIVGCIVLGAGLVNTPDAVKMKLSFLPLAMAAIGIVCSIIGTLFVRAKPGKSPQKALNAGSFGAAILAVIALYPVISFIMGSDTFEGGFGALQLFLATIIGLAAGVLIGTLTEFFTGTSTKPVLKIAKSCETGAATAIISGLGVGMVSTLPPILIIAAAIMGSFQLAGLYGVGIAALGMLMTLGIQLSVDAYGPIADNAGGLAVMSEMKPEVREITDSLDAVGNTTAAIGKGFAIGSAALTSIILFSAFVQATGVDIVHFSLLNVPVLSGLFIGGMIVFLFSSLAMDAIGGSAFAMIEEVRRQFKERPGILANTETPDYRACVDISTKAALKKMILPGVLAIGSPIVVGFLGGVEMLTGLLAGCTVTGVLMAIFMSNAGGAWDNAKKLIEGRSGTSGKGSAAHKAAVVGDTVGDPFKDTAGPALNILIKLMSIISLIIAPMIMAVRG